MPPHLWCLRDKHIPPAKSERRLLGEHSPEWGQLPELCLGQHQQLLHPPAPLQPLGMAGTWHSHTIRPENPSPLPLLCPPRCSLPVFHLPWDWAGWEAGERCEMCVCAGECPLECPGCGGERGRQAHQPGATQWVIPDYPNLKNKK